MRSLKYSVAALLAAALVMGAVAPAAVAGGIPARPEKLKFPELKYDAPVAKDYRTTLKNGMVAYMVPDLSLPLVNVTLLLRLGPDQDPAGKEGAGGMMMDLLTSAGTASLTAEQLEDKVAALGADLNSGMGGGRRGMMGMGGVRTGPADSWVSLNLLAKDLDQGLALLTDCLQHPAFQDDRVRPGQGALHPAHEGAQRQHHGHRAPRVEHADGRPGPLVQPLDHRGVHRRADQG